MTQPRVPFVDLQTQYDMIRNEVEPVILDILRTGDYISGNATTEFETSFARFCRAKYAIGVANGTDALTLALKALGAGPGKEVVTVSHTFIATAEAIVNTGATPRFVDVQTDSATMDPTLIAGAITEETCAIVAVHLYGRPADMDAINAVAAAYELPVVEDAAQAQGARYKDRLVGSLGTVGCFSFYPSKNLGAAGDAGAIATNNEELADRIRVLANHGGRTKYVHETVGFNSRLDSIQAAVLNAKLAHIDDWNGRRQALASEYQRRLKNVGGVRLPAPNDPTYKGVHHLFAVRVDDRDGLQLALKERGIASGVHYPIGVHRQQAFAKYNDLSLPNTEDWADHELSLPMFETMTLEQLETVCDAVAELCPAPVHHAD